jgi:hypothetical protein
MLQQLKMKGKVMQMNSLCIFLSRRQNTDIIYLKHDNHEFSRNIPFFIHLLPNVWHWYRSSMEKQWKWKKEKSRLLYENNNKTKNWLFVKSIYHKILCFVWCARSEYIRKTFLLHLETSGFTNILIHFFVLWHISWMVNWRWLEKVQIASQKNLGRRSHSTIWYFKVLSRFSRWTFASDFYSWYHEQ